ncbi:MAG: outer membrane protein assembly factor BamD [Candidatus Omnitrophica bacterium]|nr:outer membrane protein assembly factor BamD [Candidatus Omnitrophota bacterium]
MRFHAAKVIFIPAFLCVFFLNSNVHAFWIWTPETNKWVNPKYAVKDTPSEQLDVAKALFDQKEYDSAIKEFNKLVKHYPRSREAAEAQYYIGVSQEAIGNYPESFKAYQVVIDKYPFSERAAEIVDKQFNMAVNLMEGKYSHSKWVQVVSGSDYQVIEIFRQVIKNAPYGKHAGEAQYKIGLYLKEKRLYEEARDEFEKTINDYPKSDWAKAAKYQIALTDSIRGKDIQRDQQTTSAAVNEFKEFIEEHPDTELSQKAKEHVATLREKEAENHFQIAQFYIKQKNYKAAKVYFNDIINDYNDTIWAKRALEMIQQLGKEK